MRKFCYTMKNKKGISMIEVLITIAIIAIVSSVTTVFLNSNKADKELEAAALEVVAAIRETQNNALSGKKISDDHIPCGFEFSYRVGGSTNRYSTSSIYRHEGEECSTIPSSNEDVYASYVLKSGVIFTGSGEVSFSFSVPFGNVNPLSNVSIELEKSGSHHYVCVTNSGKVYNQRTACL